MFFVALRALVMGRRLDEKRRPDRVHNAAVRGVVLVVAVLFVAAIPVRASAQAVAAAMTAAVKRHIGGEPQTYVSPIAPHGARVVSTCNS